MNPKLKDSNVEYLYRAVLSDHRVYSDIVQATGASTATISRVTRSLNYGADGYDIIFERLDKEDGRL